MSATLTGAIYATAAFSSPFGLLPRIAGPLFLARCFAVWLLTALLLFFLDDFLTVLFFAAVVLFVLAPSDPLQRICFFFVAAPCLPAYLQVYLPFPGINWLIMLTYYKVVTFAVLAPIFFRSRSQEERHGGFSISDACVVLYVILTVLFVTVSMGFTAGPRFLIDQLLLIVIPYFAISRVVRSVEDLELCFRAILLVSLILASIAIVSTLKQWDFYRLKEPPSVFLIPDIRSGLIRIAATANTHSLGFHLAIGVIVLEYLKKALQLGTVRLWLFRGMLLVGLLSTSSRGAILALVVAIFVYTVIMIRSAAVRWMLLVALLCAAIVGGVWLVTTESVTQLDAYNTVGYRQLLLQVSLQHIQENLIFGDLFFLSDPKFQVLVQGQGIIDITNMYLQITLCFGLVGLAVFAMIFVPSLWSLLGVVSRTAWEGSDERQRLRRMSVVILSLSAGWSVLIMTTSDVALTLHLGLILIALGRAVTRFEASRPGLVEADRRSPSLRGLAYRIRPVESTGG
jgi:hypothetical protein